MAEIRVESFPFDSDFDGYDDKGYPVYDRAVGARTYRSSLEQFFSDGVFGTPANALQIGKGSGLSVTIQPGIGIIRGAIGGVFEDPVTLELDAKPPQGNIAYSIMLRCDDNDDRRSMFLTVVKGTADTDPTPPAPTENALIKDIRLGYVVVPSGATDLANATVTNEKGLSVCPYAAPFEEIDVDGIVGDFKVAANEALNALLAYFEQNRDLVDSAIDGTTAGYLQSQITAIQEQLANTDLSGSVDNETIEYATAPGEDASKLRVKDGGISSEKIEDGAVTEDKIIGGAVTQNKLDVLLQIKLGIYDSSQIDTADELMHIYNNGDAQQKQAAVDQLFNLSWPDIVSCVYSIDVQYLSNLVGSTKDVSVTSIGSVPFQLVGVNHDDMASGGKARLSFVSKNVLYNDIDNAFANNQTWNQSHLRDWLNSNFKSVISDVPQSAIKQVKKKWLFKTLTGEDRSGETQDYIWVLSTDEVGYDARSDMSDGTIYDYYSPGGNAIRKKTYNGSASDWVLRSTGSDNFRGYYVYRVNGSNGQVSELFVESGTLFPVAPGFCI